MKNQEIHNVAHNCSGALWYKPSKAYAHYQRRGAAFLLVRLQDGRMIPQRGESDSARSPEHTIN